MYNEEMKWISQTLMTYKDETYATDGYLRISIFTTTKDYKNFNPPKFGISISNQMQRSFNLNYANASDLLKSFNHAFKNGGTLFKENSQIVKQQETIQFIMEFTTTPSQELVVKLMIKHGETDYTVVIIPSDMFQLIANSLKYFVDKYQDICMKQYSAALQGETTELLQQLPSLVKQMPSQILTANYPDSGAPPPEVVKTTELSIKDLDQFVGGSEMKNIEVKELGETKEDPVTDVDSPFVKHFIKGDLRNLETILNNTNSIEEIGHKMHQDMKMGENINILPGITESEDISLLYVSKMLVNSIELSWTKFETPIPSSIPIMKYKAKDNVQPENIDLAYDLLLMSGYIRTVRRRLEDKIGDANENKAMFHLKFRCYLDPFCYSFLEKIDKTKLTSIIINRYKYFDKLGVFKEYKNTLKMHNCTDITDRDISSYVNEVAEKVIGKSLFILELHDNLKTQNNFRIGANSNFTKEQIINEIVPLEVSENMGQSPPEIEVSDEVKQFFKGKRKVEKKVEKKNHLERVVNTLQKDIPAQHREGFLQFINSYAERDFNFDGVFPYQEFGDDLIKALYVWKPETDPRIKNSLKYYQTQIENEVMEKEYILALDEKKSEPEVEIDIDWDV